MSGPSPEVYAPAALFDLTGCPFAELFQGLGAAWEALPRLQPWLEAHVRHELLGEVEPGAFVFPPVYLAPGAKIEAGAYVRGPVWLGPGTVVRHGAYLRGMVLAGRDCILGHDTEVKQAIFLDKASAGHFAYVGDSILGQRVNLGAGTKLANFRVFPGNVKVIGPDGAAIETGMLKLGAILGDDVQLGCNAVTAPGTVVGRGSCVYALASLRGTIPPRSLVAWRPELTVTPLAPPRG